MWSLEDNHFWQRHDKSEHLDRDTKKEEKEQGKVSSYCPRGIEATPSTKFQKSAYKVDGIAVQSVDISQWQCYRILLFTPCYVSLLVLTAAMKIKFLSTLHILPQRLETFLLVAVYQLLIGHWNWSTKETTFYRIIH